MVVLEELLHDGTWRELAPIVETGVVTFEEAALITFNPVLAAEIGLTAVAEYIRANYGDRIQRAAKDYAESALKTIQKKITDYFKRGSKKRKRRPTKDTEPKRPKGDDPESEPDNPTGDEPPPTAKLIPIMSKHTSFPTNMMCVDLGTMRIPHKGGKYGDVVKEEAILGQPHQFCREISHVDDVEVSNRKITPIGDFDAGRAVVGATTRSALSLSNNRVASFNSVALMETMRIGIWETGNITAPEFDGTDYSNGIVEQNGSQDMVAIKNQYLELHFKNLTGVLPTDVSPTVNSHFLGDPVPTKCTVYAYQLRDHVYLPGIETTSTLSSVIAGFLSAGYENKVVSGNPALDSPELARSREQPYFVNIGKNEWLNDNCRILGKKSFCLCPGQEGVLRIFMPHTQILSYQYMAEVQHLAANEKAPVCMKKGEVQFLIEFHGGVQSRGAASPEITQVVPAPTGVGWFGYMSWDAVRLKTDYKYDRLTQLQVTPANVLLDHDIDALE